MKQPNMIPLLVHGGVTYANSTTDELLAAGVPQAAINSRRTQYLAQQIDDAVASIYERFTRFAREYDAREAQAQAYKDAGYKIEVPMQVAAFATPSGKTPKEAADIILAQAAALRGALAQLGVLRMRKYEVLGAATPEAANNAASNIMVAINQIAAAL